MGLCKINCTTHRHGFVVHHKINENYRIAILIKKLIVLLCGRKSNAGLLAK